MQGSRSGRGVLPGARTRSFWLFPTAPLSNGKHTLCFIFSVVWPSQQESATVVNAFPKKYTVHFDKKSWHIQEDMSVFFFLIITDFFFFLTFEIFFLNPHKYNIHLFPCIQSPQKNSTDTGIYKSRGRGELNSS